MKKVLLLSLLTAFSANAANYAIDAHHSNARFAIDHFATSTNVGGFYGLTGDVHFDREAKTGSVEVVIPVSQLQTGSEAFTNHIKSTDMFNAEKFPEIKFVSKKFNFNEDKVASVEGDLTILDKTHPVVLTAEKFNCYDSPILKTEVCGGDFTVTIDRTLWGVDYLVDIGMTKDVKIDIQVEAGKK